MPTAAELAAQLRVLADQVAALAGASPTPVPTPTPTPAKGVPAKPTGLTVVLDSKQQPVLTWATAADATSWDVLDLLDPGAPVKETVTAPRSVRSALKPGARRRYAVQARNTAGTSPISDAVDVPQTSPAPSPAPTPAPVGGGVDLSRWKLTIPEASGEKVVEIRPPALATYSSKYFERLPGGSLRFRCWHGGGTTSGSSNPRSELRERVGDDPEGYWVAGKGRHVMEWSGQVNRLTRVKPHVVIGQVHDDKDDVVVWRVEADKLWLTNGDDPHGFLVDDAFETGKPYTCRYEITDGKYAFFYNSQKIDYTLISKAKSYFKVGNYLQSNPKSAPKESIEEYSEVILREVTVTHS